MVRFLIIAVLVTLGVVLQDQTGNDDAGFYESVLTWLFIGLLLSLTK